MVLIIQPDHLRSWKCSFVMVSDNPKCPPPPRIITKKELAIVVSEVVDLLEYRSADDIILTFKMAKEFLLRHDETSKLVKRE